MPNTPQALTPLVEALKAAIPNLIAIYQFGSFGTSAEREQSDIDLGLQASKPLDAVELFYLTQQLAQLVGREVDLVDLLSTTTVMCAEIIHTGKLIYTADKFKSDMFAATAFSKYAHFNESRKPILDAIKERGSIYDA